MNVSAGERSEIILKITESFANPGISPDEEYAAKLKFFLAEEKVCKIFPLFCYTNLYRSRSFIIAVKAIFLNHIVNLKN